MSRATRMWAAYTWQGHRVIVVQQWRDPFGRRMIRIQLDGDEDQAMGLPEADFLHEAEPHDVKDTPP